jgi:flagellar motor switch protein FliG
MRPRINEKSRVIAAQSRDKETNRVATMTQAQISNLLHQPSQKKIVKREEIRQKSLANEVKDCSFRPTINSSRFSKNPTKI